jgi:hypothetical protein
MSFYENIKKGEFSAPKKEKTPEQIAELKEDYKRAVDDAVKTITRGWMKKVGNRARNGKQDATIYARVLVNGIEARCLQASTTKEFKSDSPDILAYIGTIEVEDGDIINLQVRTTNTNLKLIGSTVFDTPVAASINFEKISTPAN